jgi:hypothetical protein
MYGYQVEALRIILGAFCLSMGDWLLDGKSHYGDGVYKEAGRLLGYHYQDLAKFKRIAELFQIKERSLNISYNHHVQVAHGRQHKLFSEMLWRRNKVPLRVLSDPIEDLGTISKILCRLWATFHQIIQIPIRINYTNNFYLAIHPSGMR